MKHNLNVLPEGKALPKEFKGEKPLHLSKAMVSEGSDDITYKVLCESGKFVDMPEAALVDVPKPEKAEDAPAEPAA